MPINVQAPSLPSPNIVRYPGSQSTADPNAGIKNALYRAQLDGETNRNALAKKKLDNYEAERQAQMVQATLQTSLEIARTAGPEAAQEYFKNQTGKDMGFTFRGEKIKMKWDTPDGYVNEIEAYPGQLEAAMQHKMQGGSFEPNALTGDADSWAGFVSKRTKKKEDKPQSRYGEKYFDKATGSWLQRDVTTGKEHRVAGEPKPKDERGGDDAVLSNMRRMFGETDVYGLDEEKADKALEASDLAKQYMTDGMDRIPALRQAFQDVRKGVKVKEGIEGIHDASRSIAGFGGNMDDTKKKVAELRKQGATDEMISARLIDAGWEDDEITEIMGGETQKQGQAGGNQVRGEIPKQQGQASPAGKTLDAATAAHILQEAGGDKEKARALAKQKGYQF